MFLIFESNLTVSSSQKILDASHDEPALFSVAGKHYCYVGISWIIGVEILYNARKKYEECFIRCVMLEGR